MPEFSEKSRAKLLTCHSELQRLFNAVVVNRDCTVVSGYRGELEQNELYRRGMSMKKFPYSKHNTNPSLAVDVMPYFGTTPHLRWDDIQSSYNFVGFVQGIADTFGIRIRSGADWNMNDDFDDQSFIDVAHYELVMDD